MTTEKTASEQEVVSEIREKIAALQAVAIENVRDGEFYIASEELKHILFLTKQLYDAQVDPVERLNIGFSFGDKTFDCRIDLMRYQAGTDRVLISQSKNPQVESGVRHLPSTCYSTP